jgi:heparan-alpha-glucosaminide N-acetyltransferase
MYVGHSLAYNLFPWRYRYGPMNTHFDRLVENLWGTSLWVFVAYIMFKKKIFLKV